MWSVPLNSNSSSCERYPVPDSAEADNLSGVGSAGRLDTPLTRFDERMELSPNSSVYNLTSMNLLSGETRGAILSWRMTIGYAIYSICLLAVASFLLLWNIKKYIENGRFPHWEHNFWEEVCEVSLSAAIIAETGITLALVGWRGFMRSGWLRLDLAVAALCAISLLYAALRIGK